MKWLRIAYHHLMASSNMYSYVFVDFRYAITWFQRRTRNTHAHTQTPCLPLYLHFDSTPINWNKRMTWCIVAPTWWCKGVLWLRVAFVRYKTTNKVPFRWIHIIGSDRDWFLFGILASWEMCCLLSYVLKVFGSIIFFSFEHMFNGIIKC